MSPNFTKPLWQTLWIIGPSNKLDNFRGSVKWLLKATNCKLA